MRPETVRGLALSIGGAMAMALAIPPVGLWPLGVVAWVPLALITASHTPGRAALLGWLQGTLAQASALVVLPSALRFAGGSSPGWALGLAAALLLVEGARFGAIAALSACIARRGWPLVTAFPVALVAIEWLYPMLFPWTTALLLEGAPVLLQAAELGGPLAISLWVGFVDAALAAAWLGQQAGDGRAQLPRALGLPVSVLALVAGLGAARMRGIDARVASAPVMRVGIVQGDLAAGRPAAPDPLPLYRAASVALLRYAGRVDLLVWPETAIPYPVADDDVARLLARRAFRDDARPDGGTPIDVPLLAGMVVERRTATGEAARRFNSAVLVTPDGRLRGIYDKRALVMFGEYMPAVSWAPNWLRRAIPSAGTFTPGASAVPLILGRRRIGALICYEDIKPDLVRRTMAEGDPDLLVNLTSDAWFGHSSVDRLHLALARLRAIEQRRFLVRSTNTGVSGVVDPAGRLVSSLPSHQTAAAAVTVRALRGRTPYQTVGDTPWVLTTAIAAGLATFRRRRTRRP